MRSVILFLVTLLFAGGLRSSHAQWKDVKGIEGGKVSRFVKAGNTILAVGQFSGVYSSTDFGSSWTWNGNSGFPRYWRGWLDFSANGNRVYVTDGTTLLGSTDFGLGWKVVPGLPKYSPTAVFVSDSAVYVSLGLTIGRTADDFKSMTVSDSIPGVVNSISGSDHLLFASDDNTIYASVNKGKSWTSITDSSNNMGIVLRVVAKDSAILARTSQGVFRSVNAGQDWYRVNEFSIVTDLWIDSDHWYAASGGVWRSSDNGVSWIRSGDVSISFPYGTLTYNNMWAVLASNGTVLCSPGGAGIFKSIDNGSTWSMSNSGFNVPEVRSIAVTGDSAFVIVPGLGVLRTFDRGATWQNDINGMVDTRFFSIAASNDVVFVGTRTVVSVSLDAGKTWATCTNAPNGVVFCMSFNGKTLYAAFSNDFGFVQMYRTSDRGQSWTPLGINGLPTGVQVWVSAIAFTDSSIYVGLLNEGAFVTRDGGTNWESLNAGLTDIHHSHASIYDLVTDGSNLFAAANEYVYMSSDRGVHWKDIGIVHVYPLPTDSAAHHKVTIHGTNLFIDSGTKVAHSPDYGKRWNYGWDGMESPISGGFPGSRTLVTTATQIFATSYERGPLWRRPLSEFSLSTATQVYPRSIVLRATPVGQTRDTTFHIRNTGIDTLKVQDILTSTPDFLVKLRQATIPPGQAYEDTVRFTPTSAVAYSAKIVIVSNSVTSPDTVLVSTSGVASVALEGQSPKEFLIDQNFPNPFNPSTTIRYGLPNRSHVTLSVFNTLGQQVSILQNGDQEAGYHEVRFDGANLPSGVYFYRMQTGSFTETKKFLLVR